MSADGSWNVTINSPMGAQEAVVTLVTDGNTLSGNMAGAQGTQEFSGGTVDGDAVAFGIDMTKPMPMKLEVTGTVSGDSIEGNVKLGAFGNATFSGTRV
jgi:hypothetical protein